VSGNKDRQVSDREILLPPVGQCSGCMVTPLFIKEFEYSHRNNPDGTKIMKETQINFYKLPTLN
jgi:hypothetical protein